MMDPLIPFARSTLSLTSGTSDTPSVPMTDSGLDTLRPHSPRLIELSDDNNSDSVPPRKPLAFSAGAGVTPAEKLRSLLRQMESDVRDPPPTPPTRRPATPQLIDAPISNLNSNAESEDEPPTPPPRIHAYAREEEPEAGPSKPRRLPSRAVALQAAMSRLPEEKPAPRPNALETFIAKHHDTPEAWKPPRRMDKSTSRESAGPRMDESASRAEVGRAESSTTIPRRRAARRTTIEAPPDDSMAFAAGIQDPSIDMDVDASMPAPWEESSEVDPAADRSADRSDRSRGSRRSDRSSASTHSARPFDESVDFSPEKPKNRFQARRFVADLSDELPERPDREPSRRSTRSDSPTESRTVRAGQRWRQARSPTGSFATAQQIGSTSLDLSLPQVEAESSDEDSGAMRNRASMFRPSSESPKSRNSESPKSRNRTTASSNYVDAASRSRDWASQVSKSQPYESFEDEVERSLDEPEPRRFGARRRSQDAAGNRSDEEAEAEPPRRFSQSQRSRHSQDDDDEREPPRRFGASSQRSRHSQDDDQAEPSRRLSGSRNGDEDEVEPPRRLSASRSRESLRDDRHEDEPEPPRRLSASRSRESLRNDHDEDAARPPSRRSLSRDDGTSDEAEEPEPRRRLRISRSREFREVDEELSEPPQRFRRAQSRSRESVQSELVQIEEEVERSVDDVPRPKSRTSYYEDGSEEHEERQSSNSIYEPLRWSQSKGSIDAPSRENSRRDEEDKSDSRSRYDTPDETRPSHARSASRYDTPEAESLRQSTKHSRRRYDTLEEPSPEKSTMQNSRSRYNTPEEPSLEKSSVKHSRNRYDEKPSAPLQHSRNESQAVSRHSRSRYDTSDVDPSLRPKRSKEELAEEASRTSLHASQLRGFSFPRKRTRSDEADLPAPPTPSPPKPLEQSYLRPQKAAPSAMSTPVRPSGMRASALRKSARATPTPNRVRWSPDVAGGLISPPQSSSFDFTAPSTTPSGASTTPPHAPSTTPPHATINLPSTSPPTTPPRTPAPPAPSEPQSPLQPLATPTQQESNSSIRTPHPPGWFPATPLAPSGASGSSAEQFSTPAQASKPAEPGSAMRTPHPPGWFNPAAGPSTPGAKFFATPAPKEKEKQEVRGVGVGAGFTTPLQPQQPYFSTPKPPGGWSWTPAAGSRLRNEITLDSSQSSAESSFERSLLGNGDVHRLKLSPRRKAGSPKTSPSSSMKADESFEDVSLTTPKKGSQAWPPADQTPDRTPKAGDPPTPLSERLLNNSHAEESFMDDSFLQADTSVMARVRSFLSPSKDADLRRAREQLEAARTQTQASRREIEDAQKAWLAALASVPAPSAANAATSTESATAVEAEKTPGKWQRNEWPWAYWAVIALVEIGIMWAVFRVTVDWVDAERARTSSALVRRLPAGLGVFRRNTRSSNLFDLLELLGLRWAPQERRWNVPT